MYYVYTVFALVGIFAHPYYYCQITPVLPILRGEMSVTFRPFLKWDGYLTL